VSIASTDASRADSPLVICGDSETLQKLKRNSGCRRLGVTADDVVWVELEEVKKIVENLRNCSQPDLGNGPEIDKLVKDRLHARERLGRLWWGNDPSRRRVSVLIWVADGPLTLVEIDKLVLEMAGHLQADKTDRTGQRNVSDQAASSFFSCLIAVIPRGFDHLTPEVAQGTVERLEAWSGAPGRSEGAVQKAIPVFLMTECGRMEADGRLWPASDIWPVAVGRLLGSLSVPQNRLSGLRAWRTFALLGKSDEPDPVGEAANRAILRIENYEVERTPNDEGDEQRNKLSDIQYPSPDLPIQTNAPSHPFDDPGNPEVTNRLSMPGWWYLRTSGSSHEDAVGYQERVRTDFSPKAPAGPWDAGMKRVGEKFRKQRGDTDDGEARRQAGKDSLHRWAWSKIHGDPLWVKTVRANAFLTRDGGLAGQFNRSLEDDLRQQQDDFLKLQAADDERAAAVKEAKAALGHLEKARKHFVSTLWRTGCALAAAMFASTTVGSLPAPDKIASGLWALQIGLTAAAGAFLATLVLLWFEVRAGRRATKDAEARLKAAEQAISKSYQERIELVRRGGNIRRHTVMFQAANRTSDTALRLEIMMRRDGLGNSASGGGDGTGEDSDGNAVLREYERATSGILTPSLAREDLEHFKDRMHPGWLREQAASYLHWWRQQMIEHWDVDVVGAIRDESFTEAYRARWRGIYRQLEQEFRELVVTQFCLHNEDFKVGLIGGWTGLGSDVPGLSCMTERQVGWERRRHIHVMAPSHRLAKIVAEEVVERIVGGADILCSEAPTDGWGGIALVVDEIDITLLAPGKQRVPGIDDRSARIQGWRVVEGRRESRTSMKSSGLEHA